MGLAPVCSEVRAVRDGLSGQYRAGVLRGQGHFARQHAGGSWAQVVFSAVRGHVRGRLGVGAVNVRAGTVWTLGGGWFRSYFQVTSRAHVRRRHGLRVAAGPACTSRGRCDFLGTIPAKSPRARHGGGSGRELQPLRCSSLSSGFCFGRVGTDGNEGLLKIDGGLRPSLWRPWSGARSAVKFAASLAG